MFSLEISVSRRGSSSDSGYTVEKGIELLISTLVVGEAGVGLVVDLVGGLDCSMGGTGSAVGEEGDETGERNEKTGVAH